MSILFILLNPGTGCHSAATKLPVFVIFHTGYFVLGWPVYPDFHRYVNPLVAATRVLAVYVDYSLPPSTRSPLPTTTPRLRSAGP